MDQNEVVSAERTIELGRDHEPLVPAPRAEVRSGDALYRQAVQRPLHIVGQYEVRVVAAEYAAELTERGLLVWVELEPHGGDDHSDRGRSHGRSLVVALRTARARRAGDCAERRAHAASSTRS